MSEYYQRKYCVVEQALVQMYARRHEDNRRKILSQKMNIALKEAYETQYWLKLLKDGEYITKMEFNSLYSDNQDISNIIAKIILTSKQTDSQI